jgi:Putative beta-barrel porin-2, OmpL-like. bbp2
VQLTQFGVGGDFHYDNVRARLMTQFGLYSQTTPRNDASPARGQWNLADAYRYVSEADGGYHFDIQHGVNVDAGIFMSYFTENPGDPYKAWDVSVTGDYMPSQYFTYRLEYNHRTANVPYFSGAGGVTPPGGNTGAPGSLVPGWSPDLRDSENRITGALLVKF